MSHRFYVHIFYARMHLRLKIFAHLLNNDIIKTFYVVLIELQKYRWKLMATNDPRLLTRVLGLTKTVFPEMCNIHRLSSHVFLSNQRQS